jgi:hypothetical protein
MLAETIPLSPSPTPGNLLGQLGSPCLEVNVVVNENHGLTIRN